MSEPQLDERALRKRIEKRIQEQTEFWGHLVAFVIINILVWAIFFLSGASGFPWPIFVTGGWGIGIFFHGLDVAGKSEAFVRRREEFIRREIEREKARLGIAGEAYEKPKRRARLTEDGEIDYSDDEPVEDEEDEPQPRARRRSQGEE